MIKYEYMTDNGKVEANFETLDELDRFLDELREKEVARQKHEEERMLEEERIQESERRARIDEAKKRYDEIHDELKALMLKAKRYDIEPKNVVNIITSVLTELIDEPEED